MRTKEENEKDNERRQIRKEKRETNNWTRRLRNWESDKNKQREQKRKRYNLERDISVILFLKKTFEFLFAIYWHRYGSQDIK